MNDSEHQVCSVPVLTGEDGQPVAMNAKVYYTGTALEPLVVVTRSGVGRMASEQPQFLTVEDVAKRWGLCTRTICRFMDSGELPYVEFGRAKRIRLADGEAFEQARVARYRERGAA